MAKVYVSYDGYGVENVDEEFIHFILDVVIGIAKLPADLEVGLVLTGDERMRELNCKYRGKDKPADILSFAYREIEDSVPSPLNDQYVGDIYISRSQLVARAQAAQVTEQDEFVRLFIHGLLHLAGIHHESRKETAQMEALEDKIIDKVRSV